MGQLKIRLAKESDYQNLVNWLNEPGVLQWFPMNSEKEVEHASQIWVYYAKMESCFIAEWEGVPCGSVLLNLSSLGKIRHQCLISIIVSEKFRNQGIGAKLLNFIEKEALEKFHLELLHLEVYENNPARRLYERAGFVYYGEHPQFLKEASGYKSKILMQKWLINRKG